MIGLNMFADATLGDNSDQTLRQAGINSAITAGVRSTPILDRK